MGLIRRPYRTRMRLYHDSNAETEVIWYFAHPDAKPLPFPTPFGSGLHRDSDKIGFPRLGEVLAEPLEYHPGRPRTGYMIRVPLGTEQQLRRGASINDPHFVVGQVDTEHESLSLVDGWSPGTSFTPGLIAEGSSWQGSNPEGTESGLIAEGSSWQGSNPEGIESGLIAEGTSWQGSNPGGEESGLIADGENDP